MNCQVYLKDGLLCVSFNETSMIFSEIQYQLGNAAADFSMLPERLVKIIFGQLRAEFLLSIENQENETELLDTLRKYVVELTNINPYFVFYMDIYVFFFLCLRNQRSEIPIVLRSFLTNEGKAWDIDGVDFSNMEESSLWVAEVLVKDINNRQTRLKEDYDAITGGGVTISGLTPMQHLYLLSKQGRNYLSGEFKTTLKPTYPISSKENDPAIIKSILLENAVDIVEMIEVKNLDDLLSYEMYQTLKSELLIRKCKHCGEYFIVRGRIDIEYCDRIKEGERKPCSIIGATRNYWGSKAGDPIHTAFQKAYKRNHSRQRTGKMTSKEFYEWSEEARRKRGECEVGKLTIEEFTAWLGNKS